MNDHHLRGMFFKIPSQNMWKLGHFSIPTRMEQKSGARTIPDDRLDGIFFFHTFYMERKNVPRTIPDDRKIYETSVIFQFLRKKFERAGYKISIGFCWGFRCFEMWWKTEKKSLLERMTHEKSSNLCNKLGNGVVFVTR